MRIRTIILCVFLLTALANKSNATEPPQAAQVARQQANCGEWQKAIESYNKALTISPKDAICLARRGYAYGRLGDLKHAFADFTTALECDTNCPDAYSRRSRLYSCLGLKQPARRDAQKALELIAGVPKEPDLLLEHAGLLYTVEKKREADEESKQVLALNPQSKNVSSLVIASIAHRYLNQHQDSINCLTQAIKLSPGCFELHWLRAASYAPLGLWTLATDDMDHVVNSSKNNSNALCARGYCYYYRGNYAKAVADFDQAIKSAPNNVLAFDWRGHAYHGLNEHRKAIDDFSEAIKLESTDADAYTQRADNYCHQTEWQKALQDTQRALLLDPKCRDAYLVQGWAHNKLGQFSQASEDYNKAVALAPQDPSAYFSRGMWYRDHKQYKNAIADLTEAIKYDPRNAINFCARASALVSDHQYEKAIADCNQSLKLNPKRSHPHLSRGIAYARLGKDTLALQDFNEAIRQLPDYGEAYFERSSVYKSLGKNTLYKNDLQKAKDFGYQSPEAMR